MNGGVQSSQDPLKVCDVLAEDGHWDHQGEVGSSEQDTRDNILSVKYMQECHGNTQQKMSKLGVRGWKL